MKNVINLTRKAMAITPVKAIPVLVHVKLEETVAPMLTRRGVVPVTVDVQEVGRTIMGLDYNEIQCPAMANALAQLLQISIEEDQVILMER